MNTFTKKAAVTLPVALAAIAMAGCSAGTDHTASAGPETQPPATHQAKNVQPQGARQASATSVQALPLDAYKPRGEDILKIEEAKAKLVTSCMRGLGFKDFRPVPAQASLPADLEELNDLRYGTIDPEQASKTGYKPRFAATGSNSLVRQQAAPAEATMPADQYLALTGTPKERIDTPDGVAAAAAPVPKLRSGGTVPQGGCLGQSQDKITNGEPVIADLVQQLNGDSFRQSLEDPRVKGVFTKWSACMKDAGFSYADPMQANDDPRFATDQATPDEIATAKADVACKKKTDLVTVWHTVEADIQIQMIKKSGSSLKDIAQHKNTARTNATDVLSAR